MNGGLNIHFATILLVPWEFMTSGRSFMNPSLGSRLGISSNPAVGRFVGLLWPPLDHPGTAIWSQSGPKIGKIMEGNKQVRPHVLNCYSSIEIKAVNLPMIWPIPTIPIIWGEPHKTFHKTFHGTHETPLDLLEGALAVPDHARSVKLGSCMTISFRLSSARQLKLGLEFFRLQMSAVFHSSRFLSKLRKRVKSCPVSVQCAGRPLPHSYIVQRWGFIELVLHGIALKNPVLLLKSMRWKPTTYSSSSTIHRLSWIYHGFPQPLIGVVMIVPYLIHSY